MKIYTLTLNPAYDVHAACEDLQLKRENFVAVKSRDAGGKGINISRALHNAGVAYTAFVVLGTENGEGFKKQLSEFDLNAVYLDTPGRIRENLTIHHGADETRISFAGFSVAEVLLRDILRRIDCDENTFVTFTGSLPSGVSKEGAKCFLQELKNRGVKIVLDCRSFDLADIAQIIPWFVKPNQQEVSQWFGHDVSTVDGAIASARKLHAMGVDNAMVSLGDKGAVLACDRVLYATAPKIDAVSTIGAGDSSIAGFLSAVANGGDSAACLATAVAFGTAACMTEGTEPPKERDFQNVLANIVVQEVG